MRGRPHAPVRPGGQPPLLLGRPPAERTDYPRRHLGPTGLTSAPPQAAGGLENSSRGEYNLAAAYLCVKGRPFNESRLLGVRPRTSEQGSGDSFSFMFINFIPGNMPSLCFIKKKDKFSYLSPSSSCPNRMSSC